MRLNEVLARIKLLHPNAYDDKMLVYWVSELDGRIRQEIMGSAETLTPYNAEADMDTALAAAFPHDCIYLSWLEAKIDYANTEYDRYNNAMIMFNAQWDTLAAAWVRANGNAATANQYASSI